MNSLTTFQLGDIQLKNKIVMAPMTRTRATNYIPNKLIAEYYGQRASAGLIITEGTSPSANGLGYPRIPGAYSDEQIQGWKDVADAVHAKGGKIFVQVMHTGRIAAQINMPEGATIMAPSAIQAAGQIFSETGMEDHGMPKEMTKDDILKTQDEYVYASERLINEAGIDGVELHAANGYLLDQFINPKSNQRTDEYGETPMNMTRFPLAVVDAVANKIGWHKTALRLSPGAYFNMEGDARDGDVFKYLLAQLEQRNLAYLHMGLFDDAMEFDYLGGGATDFVRQHYSKTLMGVGGYTAETGSNAISNNRFDLLAIGRPFIANPDYMAKLKSGNELTQYSDEMLAQLV